ncbi:MAG: hypothetical protein KGV59_04735 [Tenacibaculum sp.]|nr:hypothetical protein [Tenacibaculum sp.]
MKKIYLILSLIMAGTFFSCSSDNNDPVKSGLASISDFSIDFGLNKDSDITKEGLGTENITLTVPFGTVLKGKTNVKVSKGATIEPKSGTEVTFEEGKAKEFVVTAQDGTKKTYKVTVNVRPEVGSGTKLKSITIDQGWAKDVFEFTYNDKTNFVATYTSYGETFTYTYNDKNQIIKKKSDKTVTTYKYENGLIVSAEQKDVKDAKLKKSYKYEYANGKLVKVETTNAKDNKVTTETFKVNDKDNTVTYASGSQEFKNEFDDKKNPMKGIFPTAYSKIRVGKGLQSVNTNNVVKSGIIEYKYVYNKSDYPESASFEMWGAKMTVEYKYFD